MLSFSHPTTHMLSSPLTAPFLSQDLNGLDCGVLFTNIVTRRKYFFQMVYLIYNRVGQDDVEILNCKGTLVISNSVSMAMHSINM